MPCEVCRFHVALLASEPKASLGSVFFHEMRSKYDAVNVHELRDRLEAETDHRFVGRLLQRSAPALVAPCLFRRSRPPIPSEAGRGHGRS